MSEMESLADEYSVPLMETSSAEDIDSVEAVFRAAVKKALLLKVDVYLVMECECECIKGPFSSLFISV